MRSGARPRTPKARSRSRAWPRGPTRSSHKHSRPPAGPRRPPGHRAATHWARADVTLDGQDISGLALTLQPGLVVAGTTSTPGHSAAPPDLTRVRVNLHADPSAGRSQPRPDADSAGRERIVLDHRRHPRPLSADGATSPRPGPRPSLAAEVVGRSTAEIRSTSRSICAKGPTARSSRSPTRSPS